MLKRASFRNTLLAAAGLAAGVAMSGPEARASTENAFERIEAALAAIQGTLAGVAGDVAIIEGEVTHPDHGLAQIQAEVRSVQATLDRLDPSGSIVLSTGPIANDTDDDLTLAVQILNGSSTPQSFVLSFFEYTPLGGRTVLEAHSGEIGPGEVVGFSHDFTGPLFVGPLEVMLVSDHPRVMPNATLYQHENFGRREERILHTSDWVRLR